MSVSNYKILSTDWEDIKTQAQSDLADAYEAAAGKGATIPASKTLGNLAACINSIIIPTIQTNRENITPSTLSQNVQATDGSDAIDHVIVNPIPSQYIIPEGTKTITENGTGIDITGFALANVAVPVGRFAMGDETVNSDSASWTFSGVEDAYGTFKPTGFVLFRIGATSTLTTQEVGNSRLIAFLRIGNHYYSLHTAKESYAFCTYSANSQVALEDGRIVYSARNASWYLSAGIWQWVAWRT